MKKIQQFHVVSLTESRIRNSGYEVNGSLQDFRRNEEVVALADNECLREIRRITNHPYDAEMLNSFLKAKKNIRKRAKTPQNAAMASKLNRKIDEQLFIPEFVTVQTEEKGKYGSLNRHGFMINGEKYVRLMCGAGHARTNRAMFVQKRIFKRLDEFLRCGCADIEIIWAKWNAYYALGSSSTAIVSEPRVVVIKDCEVERTHLVDFVTHGEPQPVISREERKLKFNLFDGMGLVSPSLAAKWGEEVGCDYVPSAFVVRCAFVKGLVATFDFHRFAKEIAGKNILTDIYGNEVNVNDVDMILTESQFKLNKGYINWQSYIENTHKYGWNWGVTKCADKPSEIKRCMRTNYQFLQVLDLDDDGIEKLCNQTVDWVQGVASGKYEQALLYLLGSIADCDGEPLDAFNRIQEPFIKSLIVNPLLMKDPYIRKRIADSLCKRIREACMGRLIIDCTYQFLVSDPYALCEYAFGMTPTGLIKEHECYNAHWTSAGAKEVCALRSPLTWRSEVHGVSVFDGEKARDWYRYLDSCHIQNVHGLDSMLNSGSDMDGDCLFITNNEQFLKGRC